MMKVGGIFSAIRTSLSGLTAQMKRLETISENISNAEKSSDESGHVYQRKIVTSIETKESSYRSFTDHLALRLRRSRRGHMGIAFESASPEHPSAKDRPQMKVVEVGGEKLVYAPSHPRADEKGYVKMPDINVIEEMVDMVSVSRAYEANITVMDAAKQMAKRALEI